MNRPSADLPARLLASDATDFERRVLESALQRKPSHAASARMAKALGVTAAVVGTTAAASTLAADVAAAKTTAAAGATAVWPWVSVGVLGLVVAGAVVGTRAQRRAREPHVVATQSAAAPAPPAAEPGAPARPPAVVVAPEPHPVAPIQHGRAAMTTATGDSVHLAHLADQVAYLDSARGALSAGANRRALESLRRYLDRYPSGALRPEAIALEVEALMKLGREAEARALAQRFIAEHRGSLLARRVADVAGLEER